MPSVITLSGAYGTNALGGAGLGIPIFNAGTGLTGPIDNGGTGLGIPIYNAGTGLTGLTGGRGCGGCGTVAGAGGVAAWLQRAKRRVGLGDATGPSAGMIGLLVVGSVAVLGGLLYLGARDRAPASRKRPLRAVAKRRGLTVYG